MKATRRSRPLHRPRRPAALAGTLAAIALAAACERGPARPDILLVTIDTLRADHCSSYGYAIPTTPNLDWLATRGVRFETAYAESSTTSPSHAVLFTGRHFRSLGVTRNAAEVPEEAVTLAERLGSAGYATAAFVSSFPLLERFGFAQGFEHYDDEFTIDEASLNRRKGREAHDRFAEATTAHLKSWLEKRHDDGRPLFLWVHFVDPHAPYRAPRRLEATWPPRTRRSIPRYDSEVHYADAHLGSVMNLFAAFRPDRSDLVVVTSDHGEGLGDHGWMSHGINLHEEAVRIPLVASWPGHLPSGEVVDEPVGLIDIAPGILRLLDLETGSFSDGRPLFEELDADRPIFLQRREYRTTLERGRRVSGEMHAVVERGSKLIVAPGENTRALYDLGRDPAERRNLLEKAGGHEQDAHRLETAIEDWKKAFPAAPTDDAPIDRETMRALRSLGYVD